VSSDEATYLGTPRDTGQVLSASCLPTHGFKGLESLCTHQPAGPHQVATVLRWELMIRDIMAGSGDRT